MRGTTHSPVTAIIARSPTTSSGSYRHSTTDPNSSGTNLPTTWNVIESMNSSKREAKLSTRLVSDPAKLSWKNAVSLANSSSMPITYRCSMPRASTRFRQCMPMRHSVSANSRMPAKPRTYGSVEPMVMSASSAIRPTSLATTSGAM